MAFTPNTSLRDVSHAGTLTSCYSPQAAETLSRHILDFLPYADNFGAVSVPLRPGTAAPLAMQCALQVTLGAPPVNLEVSFPAVDFPAHRTEVRVLPSPSVYRLKPSSAVVGQDGRVFLERLPYLRKTAPPYPVLNILLGLQQEFGRESPVVPLNGAVDAAAGAPNSSTQQTYNPDRMRMVQEAAEKVVIDLNEKARTYLTTREESLNYMQKLSESNQELQQARQLLAKHKGELAEYLPQVGDVGVLIQQLGGHADTVEEHSNCLSPATPLHARALDLMAELHASEDVLSLLEDGLKAEYLSCDEYVKCVSDVGRDQFVTRFLCQRAFEQLNDGKPLPSPLPVAGGMMGGGPSPSSNGEPTPPPAVPQRLSKAESLRMEFPSAPMDVIEDVLRNVNNDAKAARVELQTLFA